MIESNELRNPVTFYKWVTKTYVDAEVRFDQNYKHLTFYQKLSIRCLLGAVVLLFIMKGVELYV